MFCNFVEIRIHSSPSLTHALDDRCDKLTREVQEKEESLAKARVDLATELQASGGASIVPVGAQKPPSGAAASPASLSVFESLGLGQQVTQCCSLEHNVPA